uniref:Transmembrane protein n=1 Tax=Aegilops tauschii subsp. strangulata TaxID=200361 RepID=A0A453N4J1_AEGTS
MYKNDMFLSHVIYCDFFLLNIIWTMYLSMVVNFILLFGLDLSTIWISCKLCFRLVLALSCLRLVLNLVSSGYLTWSHDRTELLYATLKSHDDVELR